MQQNNSSTTQSIRERIGLAIFGPTAAQVVKAIVEAEAAGVRQIWMTQGGAAPDTLTIFSAAAVQTNTIRLGTSIVPTYPRHPLTMAQQALAINDLAPHRLRLGIGSSHRPTIEGMYGISMGTPLDNVREYVTILRAALWNGTVDFQGSYYKVKATLPRTTQTPILISALRENAFRLAGEISDGAISWVCPVSYLLERALPALQAGAASSKRTPPPLIAHVPVALSQDRQAVLSAARQQLGRYGQLPFYASMFADAGYPVTNGEMSDALFDDLVVSGDEATIAERLQNLLQAGLDELLIMPITVSENGNDEKARLAGLIGQL